MMKFLKLTQLHVHVSTLFKFFVKKQAIPPCNPPIFDLYGVFFENSFFP